MSVPVNGLPTPPPESPAVAAIFAEHSDRVRVAGLAYCRCAMRNAGLTAEPMPHFLSVIRGTANASRYRTRSIGSSRERVPVCLQCLPGRSLPCELLYANTPTTN